MAAASIILIALAILATCLKLTNHHAEAAGVTLKLMAGVSLTIFLICLMIATGHIWFAPAAHPLLPPPLWLYPALLHLVLGMIFVLRHIKWHRTFVAEHRSQNN